MRPPRSQTDTILTSERDTLSALADLGPLYEPPPVPFSFDAAGWSVLGGLLLALLAIGAFFWIRRYRRNRYRREALSELEGMREPQALFRLLAVLKRTAMQAFGREEVAGLYGEEWLEFLDRTGQGVDLRPYGSQIADALYRGKALAAGPYARIHAQAIKWIQTHHA